MKNNSLKKGIYILPSLFTSANMAFGFLSILASINGHFTKAAWLLVIAIACDMLDGRIARMTKTTSRFGVQMDSLSDLVSFGVAPAIMMYQLVLNDMGKPGIAIAVLYVLAAALRLAKFNVKAEKGKTSNSFEGLPTPASAGLLISFVLSYELFTGQSLAFKTMPFLMNSTLPAFLQLMPVIMVLLTFLMVSNVPYAAFKNFKLSKPKAFQLLVILVFLLVILFAYPQNTFFILFGLYILSGILIYIYKYWSRLKGFLRQKKQVTKVKNKKGKQKWTKKKK